MATLGSYLLRYRQTGLYAIPSVHFDLVFADLVLLACAQHQFDVIAVELPGNVDPPAMAAAVLGLLPTTGVAICGRAVLPVAPGDSIMAAIWASQRLQTAGGRPVALEFVDLPLTEEPELPRVATSLPDTWLVARHGLQAYMDRVGNHVELGRRPEDDAREREMARRLRCALRRTEGAPARGEADRRVLFVGGMAHFARITALLDADEPDADPLHPSRAAGERLTPRAYALSAAEAWFAGWMGTFPAIEAAFFNRQMKDGWPTAPFNLPAAFTKFETGAMAEVQATDGLAISPRVALAFHTYLKARLAVRGRYAAQLDGDYHHAAVSCASERWADAFKAAGLRYPYDAPARSTPRATLAKRQNTWHLLADGRAYALNLCSRGSCRDLERRSLPVRSASLSPGERVAAGLLPVIRSVPPEDALQQAMIRAAWSLGDRFSSLHREAPRARSTNSVRFSGDFGRGIDYRRTIRAWAAGEPEREFFVKVASGRGRPALTRPQPAGVQAEKRGPARWPGSSRRRRR